MKNNFLFKILLLIFTLTLAFTPKITSAQDKQLVILDSDMVDLFDDGVAMMMLATEPNIKLLGVTISTGNDWSEYGTASAIRQLEGLGIKDLPVAMGTTPEYIKTRLKNLDEEFEKYGRGFDMHIGAAGYEEPSDWYSAYMSKYKSKPKLKPINESAVDFIIRTIKNYPNQVTIVEIGPQTNLAAAIEKDPEIVPLVKRVVYMAGAFFKEGNVTPVAEFNVWFDPISAKKVIRAPFKEQIFLPLDACGTVFLNREEFNELKSKVSSKIFKQMIERLEKSNYIFNGADYFFIWDVLVSSVIVDPSVITESVTIPVDVNDVISPSYGETLAYRIPPRGAQTADIILKVDEEKVKKLIFNLFDKL